MSESKRFFNLFLSAFVAVLLVSCDAKHDQAGPKSTATAWPHDLTVPIQRATFSMSMEHLPGAATETGTPHLQGFAFFNGTSGRPLAEDEAVVAVADGEVLRIDHDYFEPDPESLRFWTGQVESGGFFDQFARDQLHGRQVWLRHADGRISRYAHLSHVNPELTPGTNVEQGQPLGMIGNSGLLPSDDQANPLPRLHFELWSPDGSTYFGQGLSPLEIHQQVATAFGPDALPRYARTVVELANSNGKIPQPYPPQPLPETSFSMDPPAEAAAGSTFAAPITWQDEQFEAGGFYANLSGAALGVIEAGPDTQGAWILGAMPVGAAGSELGLTVTGTDLYGQTLTGQSKIVSRTPDKTPDPREVEPAYFEKHNEKNLQTEAQRVIQAAAQSITVVQPHWNKPFQPPLEGEMVTPFAQRIFHGILRPAYPFPGIEIKPDGPGADVLASNDGEVALVEDLPIRGMTVAIAHGGGIVTLYAQLESATVSVGDQVSRGSKLGTASTDPGKDGPIRWEVHVAGIPTNPVDWIGEVLPGR